MKNRYPLIFVTLFLAAFSCKDETPKKSSIEFELAEAEVKERSEFEVNIKLEKALQTTDTVYLKVTNNTASSLDYTSTIAIKNNTIKVPGVNNQTTLTFTLKATFDSQHEDAENLEIEIVEVPEKFKIGTNNMLNFEIQNYDIGDGLVGEFLFGGNTSDTNPNVKKNNGTAFGAVLTTDRKGTSNTAYSFDGINDYISVADNDELDFNYTQDFSISVWVSVKFPQASPANGQYDIIRKWDGNNNNSYAYAINYLNENAAFGYHTFFHNRYDGITCGHGSNQNSTTINSDAWHHVVMIKKGGTLYQYLDNVKVSEIADQATCTTTNNVHVTFGCRGQLARFFTGKIDDVRFYNQAVTVSTVKALFEE